MIPNGDTNTPDLLVKSITDLLIADSPAQRIEAARKLGRTGNRFATRYLIQSLADKAPEVRTAAAQVLADLGDPAAIEPLAKLLDQETSPLVDRSAIARALAVLQGADAGEMPRVEVAMPAAVASPVHSNGNGDQAPEFADQEIIDSDEVEMPHSHVVEHQDFSGAVSVAPLVREDDAENLAESYRRAATERQHLEAARRRSNEEASRRAAEELLSLESEAEALARVQEDLAQRRSNLEVAQKIAREEEAKFHEIEARLLAEEKDRECAQAEYEQLEAQALHQTSVTKAKIAELKRRLIEHQDQAIENQRSLQRLIQLHEDAATQHRAEEERLLGEQTVLEQANNALAFIRAGVHAARKEAEAETNRLKEARELLRIEQEACRMAEHERKALEREVKVRAEEEHRRLKEMRNRAAESKRKEEDAIRGRIEEETRRFADLQAVRKGYEQEAMAQAAREQKLRSEIESLRDAAQLQLKSIEAAEATKKLEEEAFRNAQQQAQIRIEQAHQRRSEEDVRLKAEQAAWVRMEEETRHRFAQQQQLIKDARARAEAEKQRLRELQEEARRVIAEDQQKIKEAEVSAEAEGRRLSDLQAEKAKREQNARQLEQKQTELRAQIQSISKATEQQRLAGEEAKATLRVQEDKFRLLEMEQQSTQEALRLKSEGHEQRNADLNVEIAKLEEQVKERSQQEVDLRADIERLNHDAADRAASVKAVEAERMAVEQRIRETDAGLSDVQEELRRRVEQEEAQRLAQEEALTKVEVETRARVKAEAERRAERERKLIEAEEQSLRQRSEELSQRRAAVEASRRALEDDVRRLAEVEERITTGESAQRRAEEERVRLEAEVRVRAEKEEQRLKETRERVAAAHKELGALRYRADEEERELENLRTLVAGAQSASKRRTKLKKTLASEIETVN
jgi:hypothetical protein